VAVKVLQVVKVYSVETSGTFGRLVACIARPRTAAVIGRIATLMVYMRRPRLSMYFYSDADRFVGLTHRKLTHLPQSAGGKGELM
jgi:hypothetical protein